MVVEIVAHVGGRCGEVSKVGKVAKSHGCSGGLQRMDMEFLCTLYVNFDFISEIDIVMTFLASEK